ncbi:epoxide hydrolase [Calocera cornea HHB12733]|uniref:Epoxide hydrolase n=1 Tax=Calocera cornea HHB12733 TaxID=1353952 RepID=A0A165EK97_9BASI|nr:epoxide hydrolase [Calocera cornea HHB12733]
MSSPPTLTPQPQPQPLIPASRLPKPEVERMLALLRGSRLPAADLVPGGSDSWDYGMPLSRLRELRAHWLEQWSFDGWLAEISRFEHFTVQIEGIELHYVHARAGREGAVPLLLSHGWPGSFFEFHKVIGPLSSPDSAEDPAFDLVVPSLPGFGFSGPPPRKGWTLVDTARVFNTLMVDVLGYKQYVAQGGDWGYVVTRALTAYHSEHCVLAHFNNLIELPPTYQYPVLAAMAVLPQWASHRVGSLVLTEGDMEGLQRTMDFRARGMGYHAIQSTKPATIGYALADHPLGLLAYLGEKYHAWTDPSSSLSDDEIVSTVALYFLTGTFHTSVLPYYENKHTQFMSLPRQARGRAGMSVFRFDVLGAPKSWASRVLNVVFYKRHDRGGHFAGLEMPDTLVADVREFVRGNWKSS